METQLLEEDFLVGLGLGVAAQDQGASIGGWEVNIEHLDGGELVEDGARGQPRSQRTQTGTQGNVQAVGENATKMWASMRSWRRWKMGRKQRSSLRLLKRASISTSWM